MEQNNNEIEKNDGNEELSTFNSQLSTKFTLSLSPYPFQPACRRSA